MVDGGQRLRKPVATRPTVGRIVHYGAGIGSDPKPRAAIITDVFSNDVVSLAVFSPSGGSYGVATSQYAPVLTFDHWTWPPRG